MIAMTTSSSIRVKPGRERRGIMVVDPLLSCGMNAGYPERTGPDAGLGPRRSFGAGWLDVGRPAGLGQPTKKAADQQDEAGGEEAERAVPARVASALRGPGICRMPRKKSCRSSFTS